MKKIIKLLSIAFIFGTFLMSCEGPEGPVGEDGIDGTAVCMACHNAGTAFAAKQVQYEESAHSLGTYHTRGGQCAGCHSNEGFLARMDFTSISEIDDLGQDDQTPISCRTCHNVHSAYDETDWALTFTDQVTETIFGYEAGDSYESYSFNDYGDGNMCLQCHQARDRGNVPAADATADVELTSSHWGPHYGVQGNVFQASGGVAITGSETYPSATDGHAGLDKACMTCHMNNANHSLEVDFEVCATCHTSADNAEDLVDDLHDEIDALKFELGKALAASGAMVAETESEWVWDDVLATHVEEIDTVGFVPAGSRSNPFTATADQAKAVYNYMVVYADHSYGVHNPSYIRALLNNSIGALK